MSKAATYFVISNSEEGETYVSQMTEGALLEALQPDEFGEVDITAPDILKSITNPNMGYWGNWKLIIKGEIIVPKAKEVVIQFEL